MPSTSPYRTPALPAAPRAGLDWPAIGVLVVGLSVIGVALAGLAWVCTG